MQGIFQIEGITKEEFISIINEAVESKFKKLTEPAKPKYVTIKQALKDLPICDSTLRGYIKGGLIKAKTIKGVIMIPREELERATKEIKSKKYRR